MWLELVADILRMREWAPEEGVVITSLGSQLAKEAIMRLVGSSKKMWIALYPAKAGHPIIQLASLTRHWLGTGSQFTNNN